MKTRHIFLLLITFAIPLFLYLFWARSGSSPQSTPPPQNSPSQSPSETISKPGQNTTGLPLNLPQGFSIGIFAQGLGNPRDLLLDTSGRLLVSIPSQGTVVAITDTNQDGVSDSQQVIASDLNRPHGLALANGKLYVAETGQVVSFDYNSSTGQASNPASIINLPPGGGHWSRSLLVKDNQLFTSIGSTCNVCNEQDPRRASIYVSDLSGQNFRLFAKGLRNSVFMAVKKDANEIWATDMGRDFLGNELPPDEVNIIKDNGNYGWPVCYGKNVLDTNFAPQGNCDTTLPSRLDIPAHSAPLGLAFVPSTWPQQFQNHLLVAYHGSWNRQPPGGYSIAIFDLASSNPASNPFISGWLTSNNSVLGRPVDLEFDARGNLYISDDNKGTIYKVTPPGM